MQNTDPSTEQISDETRTPGRTRQLRLVVFSSFLGSTMEYYDFLLYGTMSALVFNKVFFSELDPVVGTIASFGTFAAGYLARPLGGLIFGHFGDRLGRKAMLFWTLTLMAVASILIGAVPDSTAIGAAAPILLVTLRVVQGIAIGGEWGGSVLMSTEHATSRQGLWASFTPSGAPAGSLLSTLVITLVSGAVGQEAFIAWGWRLPFLFSAVLLVIGIVVRLKVAESPVFTAAAQQARPEHPPIVEVLRNHWRAVLLAVGSTAGMFIASSFITVFLVSAAVGGGAFAQQTVLTILTVSAAITLFTTVFYGYLSDRVGQRTMMIFGAVGMVVVAGAAFPIIASGSIVLLALLIVTGQAFVQSAWSAATPSLLAGMFPATNRYTGSSLAFQVSGVAGGVAPLVFAALSGAGALAVIPVVITAFSALGVVCLLLVKEGRRVSAVATRQQG